MALHARVARLPMPPQPHLPVHLGRRRRYLYGVIGPADGRDRFHEQHRIGHLDHIQGSLRLEADADDADLEQILGDL